MLRMQGQTDRTEAAPLQPFSLATRLILAIASLLVLAVTLAEWGRSLLSGLHSIAGRYDFSTYYAAAAALHANLHANIYDAPVLTQAGASNHVLVNPPLPYTYPPLFAIVLSPFTTLSFRTLSRIWLLGNAALWLAITLLLAIEIRHLLGDALAAHDGKNGNTPVPPPSWRPALSPRSVDVGALRNDPAPLVALALASWLSLSFAPANQTLATGQINFIVLAPLALVPWLTRHRHERWVGVAIALAAMLKFTPALLIVYLVLRRRWEAAIASLLTLVALTVVSMVIVGPGVMLAALPQALHVGVGDAGLSHNEALFAPAVTALVGNSTASIANVIGKALLAALALVIGYALWKMPTMSGLTIEATEKTARDTGDAAAYGVALCAMLLLSPTAWVHHYVWLLPAAAAALGFAASWLARALRARQFAGGALALMIAAIVACVALGLALPYGWDSDPHPAVKQLFGLPLWPLALELRPLGAVVLLLVLMRFAFRPIAQWSLTRQTQQKQAQVQA